MQTVSKTTPGEKMNKVFPLKFADHPLATVIQIALVVMLAELLVMLGIRYLVMFWAGDEVLADVWLFADPILLILILIPALYLLILRPMQAQQARLKQQNIELDIVAEKLREKEAQLLAQHRQALENRERMIQIEKLSALGTMVGGVAHEINNPLMGMMNYVEYARDKADDAKSKEVLGYALNEINRVRKIVNTMLVFVRDDSSVQASCSAQAIVTQTVSLLAGELRKQDVEVNVELADDLPSLHCSSGSLQQVLVNLLLNARDAMAGQTTQRITIMGWQEGDEIHLSVSDNGPGILEAIRPKVFDPFFTTKPVGKGTGLGLSVSRRLIEEVGGSITLCLQQGQGACFHLSFKAVQVPV